MRISDWSSDVCSSDLIRKRDADDQLALEALSRLPEIMDRTTAPSRVRLLWDVCQIPDFQKIMSEAHIRLLAQVSEHLTGRTEKLPPAWVDEQGGRFAPPNRTSAV